MATRTLKSLSGLVMPTRTQDASQVGAALLELIRATATRAAANPLDSLATPLTVREQLQTFKTVADTQAEAVRENTSVLKDLIRLLPLRLDSSTWRQATGGGGFGLLSGLGIGLLIKGLGKLFGGGKSEPESTSMTAFQIPEPVQAQLGVYDGGRQVVELNRALSSPQRTNGAGPSPVINVNVTAMDSRSFLDHADDIARAVKEALLQSHSLGSFINEL